VESAPPDDVFRDHAGVQKQKQEGYFYVGASVLRGRLTPEQMHSAADLAQRYGSGELRTTVMQNLLIVNVPQANTELLVKELDAIGLKVAGSPFWRGAIACSGSEFCKLALTETKSYARWLVQELDDRFPGFDQHLKLHVTGCPNSCGQHWIADIASKARRLRSTAKCMMLTTSAWAALWGSINPSRAQSAIAAWPQKFRERFRAYCSST